MRTLRISVRRLVEFLLRAGDLGAAGDGHGSIEAMQAGSNIHRMLQASGGDAYQAEVSLACSVLYPDTVFSPHAARLEIPPESMAGQAGFFLRVEGRADGIIDDGTHPLVIDEIKGVTRDVSAICEPVPVHEAQALCYAYLYLRSTRGSAALSSAFGEQVVLRLTYASMTTGEVRQIERTHSVPSIEARFFALLDAAQRWAAWRVRHDEERTRSLTWLSFPFRARADQQQIMEAVGAAIHDGRRLYVQAPTGSGKTIATLYPALKALGEGEVARVAYLTAKTMTRRSALECLELLRRQRIATNVLVVTARDKICPLRSNARGDSVRSRPLSSLCNPLECPLARGHYDAVNDALYDAITAHDVLDFQRVREVAARHHVCPYELQRDAARWSDVIVCDYHYAFAPSAGLMGLADEPGDAGTVFLVDEAHNLTERMREMYSAELPLAELKELEGLLRPQAAMGDALKAVRAVVSLFPSWDKTLPPATDPRRGGRVRKARYRVVRLDDAWTEALLALMVAVDAALERLAESDTLQAGVPRAGQGGGQVETYLALRDLSLAARTFYAALQRREGGYVTFLGTSELGGRKLKVFCVDPSHDLAERLEQAKASVFFSGTLLPMAYHKKLLAAQDDDPSVYAESSFDHRHLQVLIGTDVTARFSRRGPALYARIADYLTALVRTRPGNYLAFLPSYAMMAEVHAALGARAGGRTEVILQRRGMREEEREAFVSAFRAPRDPQGSLVGLCVLGGIFGESIDLPGEALVGVVVVGTGMPGLSDEREIIRDHYDAREGRGFAYAYTYPGITKVLQAAGRLIRAEGDHGVVLLLDDRFLDEELRAAFPREWQRVRACTLRTLPGQLAMDGRDAERRLPSSS